jgi:hypothetical protein
MTPPGSPAFLARSAAVVLVALGAGGTASARAATFTVKSPDGQLTATVTHAPGAGTLRYDLRSRDTQLLDDGVLGIRTSRGDFSEGLGYVRQVRRVVRETYRLPVGKRSTYLDHAANWS